MDNITVGGNMGQIILSKGRGALVPLSNVDKFKAELKNIKDGEYEESILRSMIVELAYKYGIKLDKSETHTDGEKFEMVNLIYSVLGKNIANKIYTGDTHIDDQCRFSESNWNDIERMFMQNEISGCNY